MRVVYGHGQSHIWGGSRGIGQLRMLDWKWRDRKWPEDAVRKYVLRMGNRKLRNIRPSGAFFTGSDSHVTGRDPVRPYYCFFSRTFFPVLFPPYFFSRTFFFRTFFFRTFFFRTFFPVLFLPVFLSPYFFLPYFLFFTFFPYFFPLFFFLYFFSRTFFLPYYLFPVLFQKSWRLKSNVLKYQWLFFLVHNTVVITQFMFLAEYSFKRHP